MKKEKYDAPVAEALEVKIEGVVCGSPSSTTGIQNYNWNNNIPEE